MAPSLPKFKPGTRVHANQHGKRYRGNILSIVPGTGPFKYNVKITDIEVIGNKDGKQVSGWETVFGWEREFNEEDLMAIS